jgi:hypothetical protein
MLQPRLSFALLGSLCLSLAACNTGGAPNTDGAVIRGTVHGADGSVASKVRTQVAGTSLQTETGTAGEFLLEQVPGGHTKLHLEGAGGKGEVEFEGLGDGSVVTVSVRMAASGQPELESEPEAQIRGTIGSIALPGLLVAGRSVQTDAQTVVRVAGAQGSLADLQAGEPVEVEGLLQADGSLLARRISSESEKSAEREAELKGSIEKLALPDLVVAGVTVHTGSSTQVRVSGDVSTLELLAEGQMVEIKGIPQADGSILAATIRAEKVSGSASGNGSSHATSTDDGHASSTSSGVAGTGDDHGGATSSGGNGGAGSTGGHGGADDGSAATSTSHTGLDDTHATSSDDGTSSSSTPPAGSASGSAGTAVATAAIVELHGRIESKTATDFVVAGFRVWTNTLTVIDGRGSHALADLPVGATVQVRGAQQTDGSVLADLVHIEKSK